MAEGKSKGRYGKDTYMVSSSEPMYDNTEMGFVDKQCRQDLPQTHKDNPLYFDSQPSSSDATGTKKRKINNCVIFVLVLFAIGLVAGLAVTISMNNKSSDVEEEQQTTTGPLPIEFQGEVRLPDEVWTANLTDSGSAAYQTMKQQFKEQMDFYFRNSSLSSLYLSTQVTGFRTGVVIFVVKFEGSSNISSRTVKNVLIGQIDRFEPSDSEAIVITFSSASIVISDMNVTTLPATTEPVVEITTMHTTVKVKTTSEETTLVTSEVPTVQYNYVVKLMEEDWLVDLNNSNSINYQTMKRDFEAQMDFYFQDSNLTDQYIGTNVLGFRPGSVIVDCTMRFKPGPTVEDTLIVLKDKAENVDLTFKIDAESITVAVPPQDECEMGKNNCHENANCTDTRDFFRCMCKWGWTGDGVNCTDVNECDQYPCHEKAECTNIEGSFICECQDDYEGDGFNCTVLPKDECEMGDNNCHENANCTDTRDSFHCMCKLGWTGDGVNCTDIDECSQEDNCHYNAVCINTEGSYTCECREGYEYEYDYWSCEDVNECDQYPCHEKAECTNFNGSFACECQYGYEGDGFNCTDADDCEMDCDVNAGCELISESFECICKDGFRGDGYTCSDIDECVEGTDSCFSDAICKNAVGFYKCACLKGFEGDGSTCTIQDIRLVDGPSEKSGRVELKIHDIWGAMCDDNWDFRDAKVVCKMLGFGDKYAVPLTGGYFGSADGVIWLDDLKCTGAENSLTECEYYVKDPSYQYYYYYQEDENNQWGNHDCQLNEAAAVSCDHIRLSDVRLVGGPNPKSGRVEVKFHGEWGTICDDGWDYKDAQVVCRMLGFDWTNAVAYVDAYFGKGEGNILIGNLDCKGTETSLLHCTQHSNIRYLYFEGWGWANCNHYEDAGVSCGYAEVDDIRLVMGKSEMAGRVEIQYHGTWGTVCDKSWDDNDAKVVCRMLGYDTENAVAVGGGHFMPGNGIVWLSGVGCSGYENSLVECRLEIDDDYYFYYDYQEEGRWGDVDCEHSQDAGVYCGNFTDWIQNTTSQTVTDGHVRLSGSMHDGMGRVEVYHDGIWGTICEDRWDDKDARVVCGMLGYNISYAKAHHGGTFQQGYGRIWLDEVGCKGDEANITDCAHSEWGDHNCGHQDDAGVSCVHGFTKNATTPKPEPTISIPPTGVRLKDGKSCLDGRVEVYYDEQWGTVCDNKWSAYDAAVICRMLGFSGGYAYGRNEHSYGHGEDSMPIWLSGLECSGSEESISDCEHKQWGKTNCSHSQDVGIRCVGDLWQCGLIAEPSVNCTFEYGDCGYTNTNWNVAMALEKLLPFLPDMDHSTNSDNGHYLYYSDVNGTEGDIAVLTTPLFEMPVGDWMLSFHVNIFGASVGSLDAVLQTENGDMLQLLWSHKGNLGGIWLYDCVDIGRFSIYEGQRVKIAFKATHGPGSQEFVAIDDVTLSEGVCLHGLQTQCNFDNPLLCAYTVDCSCFGTENDYMWRRHFGPTSTKDTGPKADVDGNIDDHVPIETEFIRLVNSKYDRAGRLEVKYAGSWGTVCDDEFGHEAALVICRMLGFEIENVEVYPEAFFGEGTGTIWMDNIQCSGEEKNITNCQHNGWGINNCEHYEDVGVSCDQNMASSGINSTGFYMYVEASVGVAGETTSLTFPEYHTSDTQQRLEFYYHMHGSDAGTLQVMINSLTKKEYIGDQGEMWKKVCITLEMDQAVTVSLIAVRGEGVYGDIAVDAFEIMDGECPHEISCTFEDGMCKFMIENEWDSHIWQRVNYDSFWSNDIPQSDHTLHSAKGYYMLSWSSHPQSEPVTMYTPEFAPPKNGSINFYHMTYGNTRLRLYSVQFESATNTTTKHLHWENTHDRKEWHWNCWNFDYSENRSLVLEAIHDLNEDSDTMAAVDDFFIDKETCKYGLDVHACDFDEDADKCGYASEVNDYCSDHYHWQQMAGKEQKIPALSGNFLYADASSGSENDKATFKLPAFLQEHWKSVHFFTYLSDYDSESFVLSVEFSDDKKQSYTPSKFFPAWNFQCIPLPDIGNTIGNGMKFTTTRRSIISDVAVDNIYLDENPCPEPSITCDFEDSVHLLFSCGYLLEQSWGKNTTSTRDGTSLFLNMHSSSKVVSPPSEKLLEKTSRCVSFQYRAYGDYGNLTVYLLDLLNTSGKMEHHSELVIHASHSSTWSTAHIKTELMMFVVVFQGISYNNTIAIDDIVVTTGECGAITCPDSMALCSSKDLCYDIRKMCDLTLDCPDGSDESEQVCDIGIACGFVDNFLCGYVYKGLSAHSHGVDNTSDGFVVLSTYNFGVLLSPKELISKPTCLQIKFRRRSEVARFRVLSHEGSGYNTLMSELLFVNNYTQFEWLLVHVDLPTKTNEYAIILEVQQPNYLMYDDYGSLDIDRVTLIPGECSDIFQVPIQETTEEPETADLCEHTPSEECILAGFNKTMMPNIIGHPNMSVAELEFQQLINSDFENDLCMEAAITILCVGIFPLCEDGTISQLCRNDCFDFVNFCVVPIITIKEANRYQYICFSLPLVDESCIYLQVNLSQIKETVSEGNEDVSVRLADGLSEDEGRVEVFQDGVWGSFCGFGLNSEVAFVMCKQLGYGSGVVLESGLYPGMGGPIQVGYAVCSGDETNFGECFISWGDSDYGSFCSHDKDAAVQCLPATVNCDFMNFTCGYEINYPWNWYSNSYMEGLYIGMDRRLAGKTADVISPSFMSSGDDSITFTAHWYSTAGDLDVLIRSDTGTETLLSTIRNDHSLGNLNYCINMELEDTYQLIFRARFGNIYYKGDSYMSNLGIKRVVHNDEPCPEPFPISTCDFENIASCQYDIPCEGPDSLTIYKWEMVSAAETSIDLSMDHTMQSYYNGHFLQVDATFGSSGDIAIVSFDVPSSLTGMYLYFWYYMAPTDIPSTLRVMLGETDIGIYTLDYGFDWIPVCVPLQDTVATKLQFLAVMGDNKGDVAIDDIKMSSMNCPHVVTCTFDEYSICDYSVEQDDYSWIWKSGSHCCGAGPDADHTYGTTEGHYMLADGNIMGTEEGDITRLLTPIFLPDDNARSVNFFFYMQGESMGRLLVHISNALDNTTTTVFTVIGNQGPEWFQKCLDLPEMDGGEIQVVWEAMLGQTASSHIALDDVTVKDVKCPNGLADWYCRFDQPYMCAYELSCLPASSNYIWRRLKLDSRRNEEFMTMTVDGQGDPQGSFLHADGSDGQQGDITDARSTAITTHENTILLLHYMMTGENPGSLKIVGDGEQGESQLHEIDSHDFGLFWNFLCIMLPNNTKLNIAFRATHGSSMASNIGLDDIGLEEGTCPVVGISCDFEEKFLCGYLNYINTMWTHDTFGESDTEASRTGSFIAVDNRIGGTIVSPLQIDDENIERCIQFDYYIAADTSSYLVVEVVNHEGESLSKWMAHSDSIARWRLGQIAFMSKEYRLLIHAKNEMNGQVEVAIDDVVVLQTSCAVADIADDCIADKEFACAEMCIDKNDVCNKYEDCMDGSDEKQYCGRSMNCNFELEYTCGYRNYRHSTADSQRIKSSSWEWLTEISSKNTTWYDHTFGNANGHFIGFKSLPFHAGVVTLESPHVTIATESCLTFNYLASVARLAVVLIDADNMHHIKWVHEDVTDFGSWLPGQLSLEETGTINLLFEATTEKGSVNIVGIDDVELKEAPCTDIECPTGSFACVADHYCVPNSHVCDRHFDCNGKEDEKKCPHSLQCDFEDSYQCGYLYNETEVLYEEHFYSWQRLIGGRQSTPFTDSTTGNYSGHYMVARTNSTYIAIHNWLSSREEEVAVDGCLYFMYSMAGKLAAELKVYTSSNGVDTFKFYASGKDKALDTWYQGFVPIEAGKVAVLFEAITRAYNKYFFGTVSIDDVTVKDHRCPKLTCEESVCGDPPVCLHKFMFCDGKVDCSDGRDEKSCDDADFSLRLVGEKVAMGRVELSMDGIYQQVCDYNQSPWFIEAAHVFCRSLGFNGGVKIFRGSSMGFATDGKFFDGEYNCNGFERSLSECDLLPNECPGYGEAHVATLACQVDDCYSWQDKCPPDFSSDKIKCIKTEYFCDGFVDCPGGTDEMNCAPHCTKDQFHCGSHQCVERSSLCNGVADCSDKSDELECVRINEDTTVDVYFNGEMLPLCTDNMDESLGKLLCSKAGFGGYKQHSTISGISIEGAMVEKVDVSSGLLEEYQIMSKSICEPTSLSCSGIECGNPAVTSQTYILFGDEAVMKEWPWMSSLHIEYLNEWYFICGASLISPEWAITAAHCVSGGESFMVKFGHLSLSPDAVELHNQTAIVDRVITHCAFRGNIDGLDNNYEGDLALLHLSGPVLITDYVKTVCLATEIQYDEDICYVTGWGNDIEGNNKQLMETRSNILDLAACNETFIANGWIPNPDLGLHGASICFQNRQPGAVSCHGDSGGPAVCKREDGRWNLIGVTSWGDPPCDTDAPLIYQSVAYYLSWIHSVMEGGLEYEEECEDT